MALPLKNDPGDSVATHKRVPTEAQREASRINGAKSKGPVSAEGKAIAARNATKHGLYSDQPLLLPCEDPAELDALRLSFTAGLNPQNCFEETVVHEAVNALWKHRRFDLAESASLDMAYTRVTSGYDAEHIANTPPGDFVHGAVRDAIEKDEARWHAVQRGAAHHFRKYSTLVNQLNAARRVELAWAQHQFHVGLKSGADLTPFVLGLYRYQADRLAVDRNRRILPSNSPDYLEELEARCTPPSSDTSGRSAPPAKSGLPNGTSHWPTEAVREAHQHLEPGRDREGALSDPSANSSGETPAPGFSTAPPDDPDILTPSHPSLTPVLGSVSSLCETNPATPASDSEATPSDPPPPTATNPGPLPKA